MVAVTHLGRDVATGVGASLTSGNSEMRPVAAPPATPKTPRFGGPMGDHATVAAKPCNSCGEEKPLDDFRPEPRGRHGRRGQCKGCERLAWRARYAKVPRPKRARKKSPDERDRRPYRLRYYYGITEEQHGALLAGQGGRCYVCQEQKTAAELAVDHDHRCCPDRQSCGRCIRGLLCHPCNHAIGQLRDDPERLLRAVAYLVAPPAPLILNREVNK